MTPTGKRNGSGSWGITVTAPAGRMLVVPVWLVLRQCGGHARNTLVHRDAGRDVDELVMSVEPDTAEVREAVLASLRAQEWLTSVAVDSTPGPVFSR